MGRDKRFLEVGGNSVFQRTLGLLTQTFSEIIVVLAEPVDSLSVPGCKVVYDLIPNAGSLGGLYTGLMASSQPRIFAVGCDMPFLNPDVIRFMTLFDMAADVVVAELGGRFQPMHALYSRRCIPFLKTMADQRDLKIHKLLLREDLRVAVLGGGDLAMIESGQKSFENINTPDDWARAEAEIADQL
jgi:molybdopterin-guanine dinucleotide biosynthesis protein A